MRGRDRVSAGSAFVLNGRLVTNNHVIHCPVADRVLIRTLRNDRKNTDDGIIIPYAQFQSYLVSGSAENQFDYAILELPEIAKLGLHSFHVERMTTPSIGREYAILGYPLDHYNLTIHRGTISSFYDRCGVQIIQLDASVNNGNSGGPLVELTDGGVVGIVTRKNNGLTDTFRDLQHVLDQNVAFIEQSTSGMTFSMGGFEPSKAAIASQHQLKRLCLELERSANTGIGYAFSIEHLALQNSNLVEPVGE
jgi:hypothetical protein